MKQSISISPAGDTVRLLVTGGDHGSHSEADAMSSERKGWLTPAQQRRLGRAVATLLPLGTVYHVGSSVAPERGYTPRDVDLRLMLDDDLYARLSPEQWKALADHIGRSLEVETGVSPIDFQIQDTTAANAEHGPDLRAHLAQYAGSQP